MKKIKRGSTLHYQLMNRVDYPEQDIQLEQVGGHTTGLWAVILFLYIVVIYFTVVVWTDRIDFIISRAFFVTVLLVLFCSIIYILTRLLYFIRFR